MSEGGDYDADIGSKMAWQRINATPETRAAYITKLSATKLARDWTNYTALSAAQRKWRLDNPAKAAVADARGLANMTAWAENNPEAMLACRRAALKRAHAAIAADPADFLAKLSKGVRASFQNNPARREQRREAATALWAARTVSDRDTVRAAIATGQRAFHAGLSLEEKAACDLRLAQARKSINHDIRKQKQKEALALYWTPERRAAKAEEMRAKYPKGRPVA